MNEVRDLLYTVAEGKFRQEGGSIRVLCIDSTWNHNVESGMVFVLRSRTAIFMESSSQTVKVLSAFTS
jgi:hypothetical protein